MDKPLLHLDRLTSADLGKFSVLLSQVLTNAQRARLNTTIPDIMGQVGAFDIPKGIIPQPDGIGSNPNAVPAGQKARQLGRADIQQLESLIRNQKKIEAIKVCRMICGIGLKEAKDYIDALQAKMTPPDAGPSNMQY